MTEADLDRIADEWEGTMRPRAWVLPRRAPLSPLRRWLAGVCSVLASVSFVVVALDQGPWMAVLVVAVGVLASLYVLAVRDMARWK